MRPLRLAEGPLRQLAQGIGDRLIDLRAWVRAGPAAAHSASEFRDTEQRCEDARVALVAVGAALKGEDFPKVVCICGSTRFRKDYVLANARETLAGNIVLTVGLFGTAHALELGVDLPKGMLDELHKRKIDMADEVLVLNVGGYIGDSTRSEIEYARAHGVPVRYLEDPVAAAWAEEDEEA